MWMYAILTFINISMAYPWIYRRIIHFIGITKLVGTWQMAVCLYALTLRIIVTQWWYTSCNKIGDNAYVLHHWINGHRVSVIIKMILPSENTHAINDKGWDITEKVMPYMRCELQPIKPSYLSEKSIVIQRS